MSSIKMFHSQGGKATPQKFTPYPGGGRGGGFEFSNRNPRTSTHLSQTFFSMKCIFFKDILMSEDKKLTMYCIL